VFLIPISNIFTIFIVDKRNLVSKYKDSEMHCNLFREYDMSILKRTQERTGNFRPAVSMESSVPDETSKLDTTESHTEVQNGKSAIIDRMAEEIIQKKQQVRQKKNPLDRLDRILTITVSPRIEAQWRFHSNTENRSLASWVRQAVDFYIRKHGLED
jgi:hypothetical protein